MTEDITPLPEDPYGISKLAVEQDLRAAHHLFGLNYIIFRPHNVYGERQNLNDKYRNVIGIFISQIKRNQPITIFGDGAQTRAFSYIREVSQIIAKSIEIPETFNQVFNIGADNFYTVMHLADLVRKEMSVPNHPIVNLRERKEIKHAYSDHKKVKKMFGFEDKISLEEGIRNTIEWAKGTPVNEGKRFSNIEIEENLPDGW